MASTTSLFLARGYRLNPKDDELMMLLRNEIAGKHSSIPHIDLYSKLPPWEIFPSSPQQKQKQKQEGWWCFTTLKRVSQSGCGCRFDRSVGDGCTWHDSSRPTRIRDDNNNTVLAYKKTYNFLLPDGGNGDRKTHWYMHECTLLAYPSLALCRVFLRPPTTAPSKLKTLPPPRPLPPPPHLRMTAYPYSPPDVHAFVDAAYSPYVHALVDAALSPSTTSTMPQHSSTDEDSCDEFAHFLEGQLQDDVQALVGEHATLSPSTTSTMSQHDDDSCDGFAQLLERQLQDDAFPDLMVANDSPVMNKMEALISSLRIPNLSFTKCCYN